MLLIINNSCVFFFYFIVETRITAFVSDNNKQLTLNITEHEPVTLICQAIGVPLPSDIHWFRNGSFLDPDLQRRINLTTTILSTVSTDGIPGLESRLIIPDPLYGVDDGSYSCRTANGIGTPAVIDTPFTVIVNCKYICIVTCL